jgi:soluble lytic murein transglycosylase-like protein
MRGLNSFRVRLGVLLTLAIASLPSFAAEVAVLRNGFSIRHERREVVGDVTRLYVSADGSSFVDIPTAEIEHFEAAPELPASTSRLQPSASRLPTSAGNAALHPSPFARTSPHVSPVVNLNDVVSSASDRYRLDPDLVNSVIKAESGFNARAVSPKGAQGLMQLMPRTASQLGVPDAFDPQANVEGGTKYLRELLELYNFDLVKALAAYNAGPRRVEQFKGVPPYYETRAYVARIVRDFNKKKAAQQKVAAGSPAKSGTAKRTAAKTSTAAGKTQSSTLVQAKASGAQSSE